jgi:hypothetical protein
VLSFSNLFAIIPDKPDLKVIESFLSLMNTLEAELTMDIDSGNKNTPLEHYEGRIWLDRPNKLLCIEFGKNKMVAAHGVLTIEQENEPPQKFETEDTPAGILLRPSICFESSDISVKSLLAVNDLWQLCLSYNSPAGSIPITLYFKPLPVMLLIGWTIQNPNGSITHVHLNPDKTEMGIKIPLSVFKMD